MAHTRYSPYTNWQQVYEQLAEANPDYKQISVSDGSASVAVPRFGNQRGTDRYKFNPRNGEITETTLYKDLDNSGKIRGWIYSVHGGQLGRYADADTDFRCSIDRRKSSADRILPVDT